MSVREILRDLVDNSAGCMCMESTTEEGCHCGKEITEAISKLKSEVEGMKKHADSFVKDGRERLMAVSYNQAISDVIDLLTK